MKNTHNGLSIVLDSQNKTDTPGERVGRLLIGALLAIGVWGMGSGILPAAVLVAALAVLLPAMMLDWRKKWQIAALAAAGVAALAFVLICRQEIASGLGSMGNVITRILTEKTGYYFHSFETNGHTLPASVAVGVLLGLMTVWIVAASNPVPMLLWSVAVFAGCGFGILESGAFLAVYLLGVVLILAKSASGSGKAVFWTAGLAAALGGCVLLVCSFMEYQPEQSSRLADAIHSWRYEEGTNPLPEGELSSLGRFNPPSDSALEITMEQWSGVYLRGFVGSQYTGSGWEEESGTVLADNADLLYTLQKDYFHPFTQLSAVNTALEKEQGTGISVKITGACRAYSYLPYGVSDVALDYRDLSEPELSSFSGTLYPVDEAYLLQKELSDGAGTQEYLDAENAYRQWVYEQYLEIPEETRELLVKQLGTSEEVLSTTQVKERILAWLDEVLTYDEYASTRAGSTDLVKYLLDVSSYGYSVHYATLGTLAMRCFGIPARYVEGYIVPRSVAGTMAAGQTLALSKEYAHAWVEYYLDGVGWVPFEVTPEYENEMVYHLPPDGSGVQNQKSIQETEPPDTEEPPVKQEPDSGSQSRVHAVRIIGNILLIVLLLAILGFIIRVILLRKKLKERCQRFREEVSRESLLDCVSYQHELLETMGMRRRNVPIMDMEWDISQILFGDDVRAQLLLAQELMFSDHAVSDQQHQQVLAGLQRIEEVWKQKLPAHKRLQLKWIHCKVL